MPVTPITSAPSSRGQPSDGSATDPSGFGSLLGTLGASASDSGGTTGGTASGGAGTPAGQPVNGAASNPDATGDGPAGGPVTQGIPAGFARPAKAAGPANGASNGNGKGPQVVGGRSQGGAKRKASDTQDQDAIVASAAGSVSTAPAAPTGNAPVAASAGGGDIAPGIASSNSAAPAGSAPLEVGDALPALSAELSAAGAQDAKPTAPGFAAVEMNQVEGFRLPLPANAFGNAVLEGQVSVSPLIGNAASTGRDVPAPGIAATLLAGLKTPPSGGAPAAPLAATGGATQTTVAVPNAPIQLAAALPDSSAAPLAAAVPQGALAPGLASLADLATDAGPILIQALPTAGVALHGTKAAGLAANGASAAPAGSFGNASLLPVAISGLAGALLGGSEDQLADSANDLPLTADALTAPASGEKPASESLAADGAMPAQQGTDLSAAGFASLLAHSDSAATPSTSTAPAPAPQQPTTLPPMPAVQIMPSLAKAAGDGGGRFNIQLHPQELGRVRVELDIDHDGRVTAAISAAHPATLDLLRRDASALQQALNDAGLKTDSNALSFNLQGNGQNMSDGSGRSARSGAPLVPPAVDPLADDVAPSTMGKTALGAGLVAVDIRI